MVDSDNGMQELTAFVGFTSKYVDVLLSASYKSEPNCAGINYTNAVFSPNDPTFRGAKGTGDIIIKSILILIVALFFVFYFFNTKKILEAEE